MFKPLGAVYAIDENLPERAMQAMNLVNAEIEGAKADLLSYGITQVSTLAYPYGTYTAAIEAELQTFLAGTEDAREAIAAFGDKRTPTFHGR